MIFRFLFAKAKVWYILRCDDLMFKFDIPSESSVQLPFQNEVSVATSPTSILFSAFSSSLKFPYLIVGPKTFGPIRCRELRHVVFFSNLERCCLAKQETKNRKCSEHKTNYTEKLKLHKNIEK